MHPKVGKKTGKTIKKLKKKENLQNSSPHKLEIIAREVIGIPVLAKKRKLVREVE